MQSENNSKLNTVLLVILIGLVIVVIGLLAGYKSAVRHQIDMQLALSNVSSQEDATDMSDNSVQNIQSNDGLIDTYHNHGVTFDMPVGYVAPEYEGEAGPTISIVLPHGGSLIYITDADWWVTYNLDGQSVYIRDEVVGNETFSVYRYIGQQEEFYFFRQGNVAYMFGENALPDMQTFDFVGWN